MSEREEERERQEGGADRPRPAPGGPDAARAERLAKALRANLRRRKEQARARGARPAEDR